MPRVDERKKSPVFWLCVGRAAPVGCRCCCEGRFFEKPILVFSEHPAPPAVYLFTNSSLAARNAFRVWGKLFFILSAMAELNEAWAHDMLFGKFDSIEQRFPKLKDSGANFFRI